MSLRDEAKLAAEKKGAAHQTNVDIEERYDELSKIYYDHKTVFNSFAEF